MLQRKCACGGTLCPSGECAECRKKRLQRRTTEHIEPSSVPPIVHEVLRSPGRPLDQKARKVMEPGFGHDFGQVRVHVDSLAAESARAVEALAYTAGTDIVFAPGQYWPGTMAGDRLLAHELAHVVQQYSSSTAGTIADRAIVSDDPSDSFERAADQAAHEAVAGRTSGSKLRPVGTPPLIQRQAVTRAQDLTLRPSPFLARSLGSLTLDNFASDKATLTSEHKTLLAELARTILMLLRSYPGGSVMVTGHTDATASEAHNLDLGQQRADAVRDALVSAKVPPEIIDTSSAGETVPAVDTPLAEQRNRRVEVRFEPELPAHLTSPLTLSFPEMSRRAPDLTPRLPLLPETPEERLERALTTPVPTRSPGPSINQALRRLVDDSLGSTMDRLGIRSPFVREKILDAAHAAIEKGEKALLNAALDQTNLSPTQKEVIRETVRGVLETPVQ